MTETKIIFDYDVKNYIINKFKEIEDYNNNLKDFMINNLYNYDNDMYYTTLRDNINERYYEITRIVSDFKYLNEKLTVSRRHAVRSTLNEVKEVKK